MKRGCLLLASLIVALAVFTIEVPVADAIVAKGGGNVTPILGAIAGSNYDFSKATAVIIAYELPDKTYGEVAFTNRSPAWGRMVHTDQMYGEIQWRMPASTALDSALWADPDEIEEVRIGAYYYQELRIPVMMPAQKQ